MAFTEASCHFIPFFIGARTKVDVVFILLVFLVVVLLQTFQQRRSAVDTAVLPRTSAVYVAVDNVVETVDEEVAEIPVDGVLAVEPEGYTVLAVCRNPHRKIR